MEHPEWTELEAKFVEEGREEVVGVVLHDTAGSGQHADTLYLANPADGRRVSADFTVERDGSIWKLNRDLRTLYCLHAGRATRFKGLRNGEVNRGTIGIEICQRGALEPMYPEGQVRSVAMLSAWLVKPGETLGAIARRYYGRASLWPMIQKKNNLRGTVIVPGQVLIIPPRS